MDNKKYVATSLDDLTYKVIGCAMAVHRKLGPGLGEDKYQRALENSIADSGIPYEAQRMYPVHDDPDKERIIGYYIPDFVVDNLVILEIKAINGINNNHIAQVISYLAISGCPIGLLIDFGERSLHPKRIFPPKKFTQGLINRQWLFIPEWLKNDEKER